jgi:hypothetical protein
MNMIALGTDFVFMAGLPFPKAACVVSRSGEVDIAKVRGKKGVGRFSDCRKFY